MSLNFLTPGAMQEIEDMTFDLLARAEDTLTDALINSKGLTYGDIELPQSERILKFLDDEQRGVNAWIAQNEPEEYTKRVKEFSTDVQESGLI